MAPLNEFRLTATTEALREQFHRPAISPGEALGVFPGATAQNPDSAAAQRISAGTYPFPIVRIGRRSVVLIADIAAVLCGVDPGTSSAPDADGDRQPVHRRPGRPGRPRKRSGAPSAGTGFLQVGATDNSSDKSNGGGYVHQN